jgi:hypothetical protein
MKADIFQEGRQTFGPLQALIKTNRKQWLNLENERYTNTILAM